MHVEIRRIGKLKGFFIPEVFLRHLGLKWKAEISIDGNTLLVRRTVAQPRAGWDAASKAIAASGDDVLVSGEAASQPEEKMTW